MKLEFSWQIFEKYSNIKFHENPSGWGELFHADGRTGEETDMKKLTVALGNFANAPKHDREQSKTAWNGKWMYNFEGAAHYNNKRR